MLLMAIAFALPAMAQTGKVSLSLVDSSTKKGVMGAVIEVYPTANPDKRRHYTTGLDGTTQISGLAYGEYVMTATFLGYEDYTKTFRLSGETLNLGKLLMKEIGRAHV